MSGPSPRDDGARVEVEFEGGVQRLRRFRVVRGALDAHRGDHPVHLAERQRRGRQQSGPVGDADGLAELRADGRPGGVAVPAVQVGAPQAAGKL